VTDDKCRSLISIKSRRKTQTTHKMTAIKDAFKQAFAKAATKERNTIYTLLSRVHATDVEHSVEDGYDRYDSKFTIDGNRYICEVKCRNVKHSATSLQILAQ